MTRKIKYSLYSFILTIISCMTGCSNNFLKDEPEYLGAFIESLVINPQETNIQTITITIPEAYSSSYQIRQYPKWMEFQQMSGSFSDGLTILNFRIINEELNLYGQTGGELILAIKNLGLVSLNITVKSPEQYDIYLDKEMLDFRTDISMLELRIQNHATESVSWKVTECPDWAKLQMSNGMINAQASMYLSITCDRTNLSQGRLSGQLKIEFNWNGIIKVKTISLTTEVVRHTNPSDLIEIEGLVADAVYSKETDRLFVATKNPDRLLVFNNEGKLISTTTLTKSPNCLSLTENEQHLYIGHSGLVSFIDSATLQVSQTYEVDFNVFDLVYGENGWLYMSPDAEYSNEHIIYLNIDNGSTFRKYSNNCSSRTHFRKIKGKPLLLATRGFISPAGIILIDISGGAPNPEETYWHKDFGKRIWFSDDYKYAFGSYGFIFNTPDYNKKDDLLPLGKFEMPVYDANCLDYCAQTKSVWVAPNIWSVYEQSYVSRYHSDNYYLIKSYSIGNYVTTINGVHDSYKTVPYYIFSNKQGTRVFVIKNVYVSFYDNANAWSMEMLTF